MKRALCLIIVSLLGAEGPVWAAEDFMNFYKEEAAVVSASLRPQSAQQTPATVHVVTQQDIKDSGAITFWDALRSVPGLDVVQFRTGQGEIGIRGLNKAWTNRVLVLMDGRVVNEGFFDHIVWESIPVTLDAVDRIEVVEGPASAVYGANAVSGVINIITKTPEQMQGGLTGFTGGERSTYQGSLSYGKKDGPVSYSMNGGWRSSNRMENASAAAAEAGLFNGLLKYALSEHSGVSLSGGFNNFNTINTIGALGNHNDKGIASFTRADAHYKDTRLRAYWNRGRLTTGDPTAPDLPTDPIAYDRYDMQLDQSISLPFNNQFVFGATYRHDTALTADINDGNRVSHDMWGGFFEDKWQMAERWLLMASGRVDSHPLTPIRFSPRGSLLYTPVREHIFRVSAGTSYRNPTLLENYSTAVQEIPTGDPFDPILFNQIVGDHSLSPESMESVEISHAGRFQRVKTNVTGFWYRYKDFIDIIPPVITGVGPLTSVTAFYNVPQPLTAVGSEIGSEVLVTSFLSLFGNYSYQYLHSHSSAVNPSPDSPRHKVNAGVRTKNGGWTTNWEMHWVDKVKGIAGLSFDGADPDYRKPVGAYFLVNAHIGYAFSHRLNGLEVGINAFNLLNNDHYEQLGPDPAGTYAGQNAEIVRGRFTGTVSYKF